jgi:superfamily II DNA/RNA helicase
MSDVCEAFQGVLRSQEPDYQEFLRQLRLKELSLNESEGVRSHVLKRLSMALEGLAEGRAGTSDITALLRQAIRTYERRLAIKSSLWRILSSREEATGLRPVESRDPSMTTLAADPWRPHWLPDVNDIDHLSLRRDNTPAVGDGLLYALSNGTFISYQSEAQKAAVQASLFAPAGSTLLVILPTGGGKSLCMQLPAWQESRGGRIKGGTTLVIVPTVSLALDQERQAQKYFSAAPSVEYRPCSLTSATPEIVKTTIRQGLLNGTLPVLYLSPEWLMHSSFYDTCLEAARRGTINRLVIDEAHLVETWGAGFRTEFQFLSAYRRKLLEASQEKLRTLLFSATVSRNCEILLQKLFGDTDKFFHVRADRIRPEISYWFDYSETQTLREEHVIEALRHLPRPAILYVASPKEAKKWLRVLRAQGFERVAAYSGETEATERKRLIDEWSEDKRDIMVATSAFGVGVDKGSVRTIIHAYLPEDMERFYQEVGRAGRDGYSAISLVCAAKGDDQKAYDVTRPARITLEKALPRWEGLQNTRRFLPGHSNFVFLNTNAPPSRNPEMYQGLSNREWNEHTLLLMQRADLIRVVDTRSGTDLQASDNLDNTTPSRDADPAWLLIELLKPQTTSSPRGGLFRTAFDGTREKEVKEIRNSVQEMVKLFRSYASGTATQCLAYAFREIYPGSTLACGGCPVCRKEGRPPYLYPFELDIEYTLAPSSNRYLHREFEEIMGRKKRMNVVLEDPLNLSLLASLQQLLVHLLETGFQQFILPTSLVNDSTWTQGLVRKLARHASVPHVVYPEKWLADKEERPLCPAPTVVVYPLQDDTADRFHLVFRQWQATQFLGIPLITVIRRNLRLESESGRYLDRIDGIGRSLEDVLSFLEDSQGLPF